MAERKQDAKLEAGSAVSPPPPSCPPLLHPSPVGQEPNHGRGGTGHGSSDEPPPFGGSWRTLYAIVAGALLLWIALFAAFTRAFR